MRTYRDNQKVVRRDVKFKVTKSTPKQGPPSFQRPSSLHNLSLFYPKCYLDVNAGDHQIFQEKDWEIRNRFPRNGWTAALVFEGSHLSEELCSQNRHSKVWIIQLCFQRVHLFHECLLPNLSSLSKYVTAISHFIY